MRCYHCHRPITLAAGEVWIHDDPHDDDRPDICCFRHYIDGCRRDLDYSATPDLVAEL